MRRLIRSLFCWGACFAAIVADVLTEVDECETDTPLKRYPFGRCEDEGGDCTCGGVCLEHAGRKGVAR